MCTGQIGPEKTSVLFCKSFLAFGVFRPASHTVSHCCVFRPVSHTVNPCCMFRPVSHTVDPCCVFRPASHTVNICCVFRPASHTVNPCFVFRPASARSGSRPAWSCVHQVYALLSRVGWFLPKEVCRLHACRPL